MMKKPVLIIVLACLISGFVFGQKNKDVPSSAWSTAKIKADGDISEWVNPFRYYNNEARMAFSIANDSANIYLCFKVNDQGMQMKILQKGIVVAIDTNGKKKKHISVVYPVRTGPGIAETGKGQRPDGGGFKTMFKLQPQWMMLSGFKSYNGEADADCPNGVKARLDWNKNNEMICEILIPFKSFRNNNLSAYDLLKIYSLIVSLPASERPSLGAGGPQGGGMAGGGGVQGGGMFEGGNGGFPGGGSGSRPDGSGPPSMGNQPGSSDMSLMTTEQKFSQKFRLAIPDGLK